METTTSQNILIRVRVRIMCFWIWNDAGASYYIDKDDSFFIQCKRKNWYTVNKKVWKEKQEILVYSFDKIKL